MGLEQRRGISLSGETSQNSSPHPAEAGLSRFRNHFSDVLNRFGTRLALAALALAAPFIAAPQARAEDNQPGVKPEGITVEVDGIPVDVSGIQAGGEEPPQTNTEEETQISVISPQKLTTENFPPDVPQGQVQIMPKIGEIAIKTDQFFDELDRQVKFKPNPNLKSGIATYDLKPCETCTKTPDRWGIIKGVVDPSDPKTLIMEFNIFRPDYKLDPAYREQMADSIAGGIGLELSKVIYGKSLLDGLSQEQANYIGQLSYRLQYEIKPLEIIAPTTG